MVRVIRLLAAAGVLLALWSTVSAAPPAGKFKASVYDREQIVDLALLEIAGTDKADVKFLSHGVPVLQGATIKNIEQKGNALHFTIAGPRAFDIVLNPGDDKDAKAIRGAIILGGANVQPLLLERTDAKELDPQNFQRKAPDANLLAELNKAADLDAARKTLKELEEKQPGSPLLVAGTQALLRVALRTDAKADEVEAALARAEKEAGLYAPQLSASVVAGTARTLLQGKKLPELALKLAQQNMKTVTKDSTPDQALAATQLIVDALKANNKADAAKQFQAQIDALEVKLDEQFEKGNIDFKVDAFAGRKGKGSRVAVVELFTGAQCPPCVSADIAFDACVKAFKPTDAVFLQYHLHIPGPDALTNPAAIDRQKYYGEAVGGTPSAFLNGGETEPLGGFKPNGEERYKTLRDAVAKAVEAEETAKLTLDVKRDGDKVSIEAKAADVAKPGEKVKLRVVLVEDVTKYVGRNGQRLHHHVVRDFPGGTDGLAVKEKTATQKVTVSLAEVKEKLTKYLDEFTIRGQKPFADEAKPVEMKKLKVVAFLQDDDSKEILQAVQADVPDGK